jgi:hypothetical protein
MASEGLGLAGTVARAPAFAAAASSRYEQMDPGSRNPRAALVGRLRSGIALAPPLLQRRLGWRLQSLRANQGNEWPRSGL